MFDAFIFVLWFAAVVVPLLWWCCLQLWCCRYCCAAALTASAVPCNTQQQSILPPDRWRLPPKLQAYASPRLPAHSYPVYTQDKTPRGVVRVLLLLALMRVCHVTGHVTIARFVKMTDFEYAKCTESRAFSFFFGNIFCWGNMMLEEWRQTTPAEPESGNARWEWQQRRESLHAAPASVRRDKKRTKSSVSALLPREPFIPGDKCTRLLCEPGAVVGRS